MLMFGESPHKRFELVVSIKDNSDQPTPHRKSCTSNDPYKIWEFWQKYKPKRKRKKQSNQPNAKDATKILKEVNEYIDNKYGTQKQGDQETNV